MKVEYYSTFAWVAHGQDLTLSLFGNGPEEGLKVCFGRVGLVSG